MLERRLLIVTGKGGVGRSALTAAAALNAAKHGKKRVLAIAMNDPVGLGSHLRVPALTPEAVAVRPGLYAMAVEPAAALDEYLRLRLKVPRFGPATRAFRVLADTVPGIRDTVVMGKILFEAGRADWDLVVADAPPTGQVLSYLRAPATIESLVPSGRVKEQSAWMRKTLADPEMTGLLIVATPEELPVAETAETRSALAAEGLVSISGVAANRVLPPLAVAADLIEREPAGPRRDAAILHLEVAAAQEIHLERLKPDTVFPLLFGVRTPGEVASRLSELWDGT